VGNIFFLFFYIHPRVAFFADPFDNFQLSQHVQGFSRRPSVDAGMFGEQGSGELFLFLKWDKI
jgi:hypothetical protein